MTPEERVAKRLGFGWNPITLEVTGRDERTDMWPGLTVDWDYCEIITKLWDELLRLEREREWVKVTPETMPPNQSELMPDEFSPAYEVIYRGKRYLAERFYNQWWGEHGAMSPVTYYRVLPSAPREE